MDVPAFAALPYKRGCLMRVRLWLSISDDKESHAAFE